ncbi:MAG: Fe-S-containing protein [Dehalogenimonas sp.]
MLSKIKIKAAALLIIALSLALIVAGCSSPGAGATTPPGNGATTSPATAAANGKTKATWVTAEQTPTSVAVPASIIDQKRIIHFWVEIPEGKMPFMAYNLEGKTYVRANLCVPCRSYNYSLDGGVLDCDTCGTRFNAKSGDGISGFCKDYPKALVPFTAQDGKPVMSVADAKTSYFNTLEPDWP